MAVAYTIAKKGVSTLVEKVLTNKSFQKGLFASSGLLISYLGYEAAKPDGLDFPEPLKNLPPSPDSVPTPDKSLVSSNPTVKSPLEELISKMNDNTSTSNENFENIKRIIDDRNQNFVNTNQSLVDSLAHSPLLANQILTKDTLDNINQNLEAQTIMMGYLWETLEKNLSSIVHIKMIDAQNNKVLTDYQKQMAASSDYGDSEFFYAFIPTGEWWSNADKAAALNEFKKYGLELDEMFYPSVFHAVGETELIDRMEKNMNSKIDIRRAVEAYRREKVSSDIRSLMGVALVEGTKADTKTAIESLKATEKSADNLGALADAVAPIAKWAELAKAKEVYLATPIAQVIDLDGNLVAENVSPLSVALAKDASIAREKTDIINTEYDESDFPSMPDKFPTVSFIPSSDIYNPNHEAPASNPFFDKLVQKFSSLFS